MIARAAHWTSQEVADAVGGVLIGDAKRELVGVATDTRDSLEGHLFVALRGERFDAHDFVERALTQGAGAVLVDDVGIGDEARISEWAKRAPVIRSRDTTSALGDLGRAHRRRIDPRVFALTGSNGKTTTKEMAASILSVGHEVLKTPGNLNNLIGLPMTLLGLGASHSCAVIEMGMNALGEIARLTEIAEPDVAAVINIQPAHIGMLGSIDAIAQAKGELFEGSSEAAVKVLNADDPRVVAAAKRGPSGSFRRFGVVPGAEVRIASIRAVRGGSDCDLELDGTRLEAHIPFSGRHNVQNAAAAIAMVTAPGGPMITHDEIRAGLLAAKTVSGRLTRRAIGDLFIVDDTYNANAASMIAAIETLAEEAVLSNGRLVALLGEMRELGQFSQTEHARVGEALAAANVAAVAAFGPQAAPIARAASRAGVAARHEEEDDESLFSWLRERLQPGDVVLVKGSRGIRMERFIRRFEEEQA